MRHAVFLALLIASVLAAFILNTRSSVAAFRAPSLGWPQAGRDGSRGNRTPAVGTLVPPAGPFVTPAFEVLIGNVPGPISRIGDDGTLYARDAANIYSYSFLLSTDPLSVCVSAGIAPCPGLMKWRPISVPGLADFALAPLGPIYALTPSALTAFSASTGQPLWPAPYAQDLDAEVGALAIDSSGTAYINTGGPLNDPQRIVAVNPDGSLKWEAHAGYRGNVTPVMTTDESMLFVPSQGSVFGIPVPQTIILSAANGQSLGGLPYPGLASASPWGPVYFTPNAPNLYSQGLFGCTLQSCQFIPNNGNVTVLTYTNSNIIVGSSLGGTSPAVQALSSTGIPLWTHAGALNSIIADGANMVYSIDPIRNDLVVLNGSTGSERFRQHFTPSTSPLSGVIIGPDGTVFVLAGNKVYWPAPTFRPQRCGDLVDIYNGVAAKYNAGSASLCCGHDCESTPAVQEKYGYTYMCVEFVKRFYRIVKSIDTTKWPGYGQAKLYFPNATRLARSPGDQQGLTRYCNSLYLTPDCPIPATVPPQPDDIMGFTGADVGHVAIVRDIIDCSDAQATGCTAVGPGRFDVLVIEQNYPGPHRFGMIRNPVDGTYGIPARGKSAVHTGLPVQGWMRP